MAFPLLHNYISINMLGIHGFSEFHSNSFLQVLILFKYCSNDIIIIMEAFSAAFTRRSQGYSGIESKEGLCSWLLKERGKFCSPEQNISNFGRWQWSWVQMHPQSECWSIPSILIPSNPWFSLSILGLDQYLDNTPSTSQLTLDLPSIDILVDSQSRVD